MKTTKPQYKTIRVTLDDGSSVSVKRCALADTDRLLELQDSLLEEYVMASGSIGQFITKPSVREDLAAICGLLPLVNSKDTVEYLDFDTICENWEQLIVLFFNSSLDDDRVMTDASKPSAISQLHFFPYLEIVKKHYLVLEEQEKAKAEKVKKA